MKLKEKLAEEYICDFLLEPYIRKVGFLAGFEKAREMIKIEIINFLSTSGYKSFDTIFKKLSDLGEEEVFEEHRSGVGKING